MDVPRDEGLTPEILRALGLLLAVVAVFAWVKFPDAVVDGFTERGAVWLAVAVVATVLSSTCAVVVAVKRAEVRVIGNLERRTRNLR